ncbi:MAG: PilZ domain-containing protein [Candidatus Acidiferrum sp.]
MSSYEHLRRSSRIPKELAILLTGSDMDGKGFSEMTKTVLLSRHGAGIISTYKLSAEQEIILRYLDTNKEAVVRVVGRIGSEGEIYTYGVAFVDATNTEFWEVNFAPVSEREKETQRVYLECGNCKQREMVEHTDVESDVLMINEGIVRYCKPCRDSTLWKRASDVPASDVPEEQPQPVLVAAGGGHSFVGSSAVESGAESSVSAANPQASSSAFSPGASNSASTMNSPDALNSPRSLDLPNDQTTSAYGAPEPKPAAPLDNRRKHIRTKVSYKACIRRSGYPDDVVTCEDMSRGGICFKSRKQYFPRTTIEVAVPYAHGANAIFVPAEIAWVVEITKDKLYKCGLAYRPASRPS